MTAVAATATEPPPAPSAGMEVDYGYEDTGIDYGYGDATPHDVDDQRSPTADTRDEKQPNGHQPAPHRQRRLSAFVGVNANPSSGGENQGGGGAGGGEKKRRGRRLSMFAFAGQENEMEEFKTTGSKDESSKDSKTTGHKQENQKASKGLMRKLSDDISGHSSNHGGGMLGSFFRGGGGGSSAKDDANGGAKGPTRRRGRRLSMIAFDGGDNNLNNEVAQDMAPKPSSPPPEAAPTTQNRRITSSDASYNKRQTLRANSSHASHKTGSSGNDGDPSKKNRYYPAVQLPAEYLADATSNKPITRTVGGGGGASISGNASSHQPQYQSQQPAAGGAPARTHGRAQRRSSFGGTTATTAATAATESTTGTENNRRYTVGGASPEQPPRKFFGRQQQQQQMQTPSAPAVKGQVPTSSKNRYAQGNNNTNAQHRNGTTAAQTQQQHRSALSQSQHKQMGSGSGRGTVSPTNSVRGGLDHSSNHSMTQSPRSQRRAIGKLAVQSIPESSIHQVTVPSEWSTSLDSNEEGVVEEESELQQYMKSMELGSSSSHSVHGGGASVSSANMSSGVSVGPTAGLYRKEVAAIAREARAAAAAGVEPGTNNMSLLYILARCCDWQAVLEEVKFSPRDAKVVSEKDGTTALHLAVMSRTNPMMRDGKAGEPAPMEVIEALVQACPEAAIIRCSKKRYTPLCYACLVADVNYDMEDCARIVEMLIKYAPHSPFVFTDDGFSALDIHILSYSQLHKHKEEMGGGGKSSTVVLETLLNGEPSLADARVYRNKIRGPLELLYRCNIDEFKEMVEKQEELELNEEHDHERIEAVLSDWWAWKWTLMLLKFASISAGQDITPFKPVHAAARLVGCPLPVLALSVNTYPKQVSERDPTGDIYNLPLHEVCSWRADSENVAGDPFIATRKFKAMRMLLEQFPEAARMTNNCGETPLQLAVETCTPWHGGLEALVEACPKALKFPRKLRITDNGLALAVANHSAIDSVATNDSDEPDPLEPMENMYPFLVAAVLGGVSRNKMRPPVSFSDQMAKEHYANLERKDLQAVRAVYGLLRARPEVLAKYRQFMAKSGI
ncbi:hypothetical protein ACA910_001627 [Epithemia clementina (nom. ined.)]